MGYLDLTKALLEEQFPMVPIRAENLVCIDSQDGLRIADELAVSGLQNRLWCDIDAVTARGTWDILELLQPPSMSQLLPGYLQWLWDRDDADIMLLALPHMLLRNLELAQEGSIEPLQPEQMDSLVRFFLRLLEDKAPLLEPDEIVACEELILAYNPSIRLSDRGIRRPLPRA